ncbi:hypothetical protein [Streptomyces sp. NPDC102282]|uniref:hypothetical protein n=1 Tax=Streptomyces sp. NPDC102282 TaxID=3366154 RepID=UPI0037F26088
MTVDVRNYVNVHTRLNADQTLATVASPTDAYWKGTSHGAPARSDALLDESGVIDDQNALVAAEVFGDVCLQVVAYLVGLPAVGCPANSASCQEFLRPTGPRSPRT